ncbi:MAG: 1-(5-phosphoribosyl)-5-[Rikenellaceae bacterium]|nr:1-(5-phosphoribosyl)-5-[(5-phosphoribosylamino)methylideneamino]imidazole-4-carboxamide isomerase [Rikenellaceae bacterium]
MIELIPAIDIIDGKCVRLTRGDYNLQTTYGANPTDIARGYEAIGVRRLHVVDLDGAKASAPCNLAVLEDICANTSLDVEWGGGIKSEESLSAVLSAGANRAICGSVAVSNPEMMTEWIAKYGAEHIILGVDIRDGKVATHGWLRESDLSAEELIARFGADGLSQVICTDISKDGMLQGPTFELYEMLQNRFPAIDITVSGGISSMEDIRRLNDMGLRSVIIGKAIYEGRITTKELEEWLRNE